MLQNIRDRSQGWIAGIIISIICVTFILWSIHSYLDNANTTDAVAKVAGETINRNQLQPIYERIRQQQRLQLGADVVLDQNGEQQLKERALNQLIIAKVLSKAAVVQGFRVTPEQVKAALVNIPAFQVNGQFSREHFTEVTHSLLYNQEDFLADMRTTMLINQVRGGFINSEFALSNEIDTAIKLINQKRDIRYATIFLANLLPIIEINQQQVLAYYRQHPEEFQLPEQVSLEYVMLSLSDLIKQVQLTPAEMEQYYKSNLANFTRESGIIPFKKVQAQVKKELLKEKAEHLLTELSDKLANLAYENPNSLNKLAKELHLPVMKTHFFSRQQGSKEDQLTVNPRVLAAAFSREVLEQSSNSDLIELEPGKVLVLRINQHKAAASLPFDQVKLKIIEKLRLINAKQKTKELGIKLVNQFNQDGQANLLSKRYSLTWQQAKEVSRFDQRINPLILQKAFSLPYSNKKANGYTGISLSNGDYVLIKVTAIHQSDSRSISPVAKKIFLERIENDLGQLDYTLYIHSVLGKTKIKLFASH